MRTVDGQRLVRVSLGCAYVAVPAGASKAEARRLALAAVGDNWEDVAPNCDVVEATERRVHVDGAQAHAVVNGPEVVRDFTDAAAPLDRRPVAGWDAAEPVVAALLGIDSTPLSRNATLQAQARITAVRVALARAGATVSLERSHGRATYGSGTARAPQRLIAVVSDVDHVDRLRVSLRRSIGVGAFSVRVDRPSSAEVVRRLDVAAGASDPGTVLVPTYSALGELGESAS